MNKKFLLITTLTTVLMHGCGIMTPIGKEDFACPNEKKGGVCAGPRTIYELTNSRENLENLSEDEDYEGYVIEQNEDGETVAVKRGKNKKQNTHQHKKSGEHHGLSGSQHDDTSPTRYHAREHTQQSLDNHQPPIALEQVRSEKIGGDRFQQWPTTTEPLAPEPLSVLEPPKVMRILLNTFKDDSQNLHIPGYIYAQVEQERWSVGEAAPMRPQRVIPTQIREKAAKEQLNRQNRQQGVSPIEHQESGG